MAIHSKLSLKTNIVGLPVSFYASLDKDGKSGSTITFDGAVGRKEISLNEFIDGLFDKFEVDVELPEELKLSAALEYFVARIELNKPLKISGQTGTPKSKKPKLTLSGAFSLGVENGTDPKEQFELQFFYTGLENEEEESGFAIGMNIKSDIDFGKLPFIGEIPQIAELSIPNLGFVYTKFKKKEEDTGAPTIQETTTKKEVQFKIPQIKSIPSITGGEDVKSIESFLGPFDSTSGGFSLVSGLVNKVTKEIKSIHLPLNLPKRSLTSGGEPGGEENLTDTPETEVIPESTDPVKWIKLNKSFGPVKLDKVGFAYKNRKVNVFADASFSLSFLELSVDKLGVAFDVPTNLKDIPVPSFTLGGLSTHVKAGPLELAGGFIAVDDTFDSFMGQLIVKAGDFSLEAFGGFSVSEQGFFVFARINFPIGGPPYFFITGLSGGLGINYQFRMPTFEELNTFPLLPGNADNPLPVGAPKDTTAITKTLRSLSNYISPKKGQFWMAVGIEFNSFKMIEVQAILTVSFGIEFEVSLLGNATMSFPAKETLPEGVTPIANVSINFIVSFNPSKGLMRAEGSLTPASFVYHPSVKLTGGFAFYVWFSGEHEGDFVMTIGGYHPSYNKPAHYPTVPRLQLKWSLGPLQIIGQAYFALTPKEMMFGFAVTATFESGAIKAWFRMSFDFYIAWNPLYYRADGIVSIGVSATLDLWITTVSISVEVSVGLSIWGNPFGGRAHVDLDIISFTIDFGEPEKGNTTVEWTKFKEFLPSSNTNTSTTKSVENNNPTVSNITVTDGLLKKDAEGLNSLLDPEHFEILVQTNVPLTNIVFNSEEEEETLSLRDIEATDYVNPQLLAETWERESDGLILAYQKPQGEAQDWWDKKIGIAPMGISDIQSILTVSIEKDRGDKFEETKDFIVSLQTKNSPSALWNGDPSEKSQLISNTLTGFKLLPKVRRPARTEEIDLEKLIFIQDKERTIISEAAPVITRDRDTKNDFDALDDFRIPVFDLEKLHDSDSKDLISELNESLGFDLNEELAPALKLAEIEYLDKPQKMLLGEIQVAV